MGRVGPAHGLAGTVVVDPETDIPEQRFSPGAEVLLDDLTALKVRRFEPTDRSPLVTFHQITDRDAAEGLRGRLLHILPASRRPLESDEFWPDELVGAAVLGTDGSHLGRVVDVEAGVGQDRLVIEVDGRRFEIPLVTELVLEVDPGVGRVVIAPPPGLMD